MIFAIKRFETHDGDGIRTTLFFKGCPLRCVWCHNPESFGKSREIAYNFELCRNCLKCASLCDANVIGEDGHLFLRENCNFCGECIDACPSFAFDIYGDERGSEEIAEELLSDEMFFKGSGGGVTFSGGEPLLQVDFCVEIAKILKKRNINIAIDTCGYVSKEAFDKILPYADAFLYDIKAIDPEIHKMCTGKDNRIILENLRYIDAKGKKTEIRIPYVPDFNSSEIENIAKFAAELKSVDLIRVLPYHRYAESKYLSLGLENKLPSRLPLSVEIEKAKDIIGKISGKRVI